MQVKKQQLELNMEQRTCPKLEKEYIKAVYFHPAYFNLYAEDISCWMNVMNRLDEHKLKSSLYEKYE